MQVGGLEVTDCGSVKFFLGRAAAAIGLAGKSLFVSCIMYSNENSKPYVFFIFVKWSSRKEGDQRVKEAIIGRKFGN